MSRDIKADNILIDSGNNIKIADFGIAVKQQNLECETPSEVGSPYWMAPEVIEMKPPTPKADIWSVGCLTVELFTGKPPYFDLNPMSALFHICEDDEIPIDDPQHAISDLCLDFIRQCFVKNPEERSPASVLLRHPWFRSYGRKPESPKAPHRFSTTKGMIIYDYLWCNE